MTSRRYRPTLLVASLWACSLLAACSGNDEDRAKLVGKWNSDRPPDYVELRDDGSFAYVNGKGIKTVLQLYWEMGSGDTIVLSMADGVNPRSCHYKLESGDRLTIDDGKGSSCIPAEPDDMSMPVNYQRAPK
jgi:hypothetical protein